MQVSVSRVSIILVLCIVPISLEGLHAIKNFEFLKTSAHYLSHSSDLLGKVNSPFSLPVKQNTGDRPRLVCIGLTGLQGVFSTYILLDKINLLPPSLYSLGRDEATRAWSSEPYSLRVYSSLKSVHVFQRVLRAFPSVVLLVLKTSLGWGKGCVVFLAPQLGAELPLSNADRLLC